MRKGLGKYLLSVLSATILLSDAAYAIAPGLYIGAMAGPATNGANSANVQVYPLPTSTSQVPAKSIANPSSSQFGTRAYVGYKFNQIAGFELGFAFFSGVNYNLADDSKQAVAGTTARVRVIDLLGKVDYSIQNTVGVYGKAGVAAAYITTPGALNITGYSSTNPTKVSGSNTYTTKAVPAVALGGSYDFNQNWQMDVSWTRYMVGSSVNNMDLYALGLSYHFVDKYCGQFLCDD